ncbi:MAG TPA: ATP-binding protein [Actinomycetota bacterium]|nr:ATP-binding protein [Actinomycetota bacterium]
MRLRINDDGVGFDPLVASRLLSEGHFGLAGMRERVEMVGGHLSIDSSPGTGTTISVEMANGQSPIHVGGARSPTAPQARLCQPTGIRSLCQATGMHALLCQAHGACAPVR